MLVRDRMTEDPITATADLPITEARELMRKNEVRRLPVVDDKGNLVGIVTRDDILLASPSPVTSLSVWEITYLLSQVTVDEVMTKDVFTVSADCPVEEAARVMVDNKISGLPVMQDDELVGIITESDIFKSFLELFGGGQKGIRVTALAPYVKGNLAEISTAVADVGGLILSLNVFEGTDPSNWTCTFKASEVSEEELLEAIKPLVVEVLDVREIEAAASCSE